MHFQIRTALVTWLLGLAAAATSQAQTTCLDVIDFEAQREGAIVANVTAAGGAGPVAVEGVNSLLGAGSNAAIIFDSACSGGCSGGDADLGTPNLDFGGPGSGTGGALGSPSANTIALGNLLIVAEDLIDANGDDLVDDPDDQGDEGVTLRLDFDAVGDVTLHELTVVDVDTNRPPGTVTLLDAGGSALLTVPLPVTGNNGAAVLDLFSTAGVRTIDVALQQSAAIDNIVFSIPCDDGDACTVDFCGEAGCVNEPIPDCVSCTLGEPCDDGDLCTINDACVEGICSGLPVDCDMVGGSDLPPGTTITTDPQGNGPTPEDPITTTMTSPRGGDLAIAERSLPSGDLEFETASPLNAPGAPLVIVSSLDASLGLSLNVQYRKDAVPVPECIGAPGTADPDPCVGDRTLLADGDVQVTLYSSMSGIWTFGPMDSCIDPATSLPLLDGTACDDGIFCNGTDTCLAGSCSDHAGDPCAGGAECADTCDETLESCLAPAGTSCTDDGNVCTDNICDGAGSCAAENNAAPCDDGLFCNGADTCVSGDCLIHDGDPCLGQPECADTCDEDLDTCFAPSGTSCSDDGNECSDNLCDGAGTCAAVPNAAPCDDGVFCNGDDTCMDGSCNSHAGNPCEVGTRCDEQSSMCIQTDCSTPDDPTCDDGNPCTDDSCNVEAGTCLNTPNTSPCDDGLFCNGIDACSAGECSMHGGDPCIGGGECADVCDEADDSCLVPAATTCTADGNECTDDVCDGAGACMHPTNTAPCNDGVFCNGDDTCVDGACNDHTGDPCTGGGECADLCDEAGQNCLVPSGTTCSDDGNVCTDNTCDGAGTCIADNNAAPCDDGVDCTLNDSCSDGACQGAPSNDACDNGNVCTTDTCDPIGGCQSTNNTEPCDNGNPDDDPDQCVEGVCTGTGGCGDDSDCDDLDPCTDDACLASGACDYTNNIAPCDDGVDCTLNDSCSDGACQGAPSNDACDNGNVCTTDTCDPIGGCQSTNNTEPCDNGNPDDDPDQCVEGVCTGTGGCGDDSDCDDLDPCTDDVCLASGACDYTNNTEPCDDGVGCTLLDTCLDGSCQGTPSDEACDNGNLCTTDTCDPVNDCQSTNNTEPCDDGVGCTLLDTCLDGSCQGTPSDEACDNGNVCTTDTCDPVNDCQSTNDTEPCDDGVDCTLLDTCSDGSCQGTPSDEACDNGNVCTTDTCSAIAGCQSTNNTEPCDDGVFCNGDDMCMAGSCSAHAGNPCLEDETCDEDSDVCVPPACGSGPRLIVPDVTCAVNADCTATIALDTGGEVVASAAATMDSVASLACGAQCEAGSAAPTGICFINPTLCRFAVANQIGTITPFQDGPLAIIPVVCETEGTFVLDLTDFSLGNAVGGLVPDVCVSPGSITCTSGNSSICAGPGDDAPCDDGVFCNGVETCVDGGCAPGTPPCAGECNETTQECLSPGACVSLSAGSAISCPAGEDCTIPVFIDTAGLELGAVGAAIDAGPGLSCSSCTPGDAAGSASCFVSEDSCQLQVAALAEPATPFADGRLAEVSVSCAAPTTGEICVGALDAFGVNGVVERPVCEQVCVPYACTPANQLCSSEADCDDGIECTIDCCSFDSSTSTLECRHEDNECSNCGDGPRLAGVDTLCTVGTSCDVAIEVESGLDPIASLAGTLDSSAGLTLESLSLGACTAGSQTSSLGNPPLFSMAAPVGTAYCDGDAVIARVHCDEAGLQTLEPTGITLGDDSMPLPLPICGGCGAVANVVCVEPGLLIPCGDATLEGKITSTDSLVVLRHSVGLADPCPRSVCDVDISGDVTSNDAIELLFSVVGVKTLACGDTQTIVAPALFAPTSSTTSTTDPTH